MNIIRGILAVIVAVIVGGVVNMGIVMLGNQIIPPPAGVDPNDMASLQANMHLYGVKNLIAPFLAHALGSLVGAIIASLIAVSHKMKFAIGIGLFFMLGGIAAAYLLPAPLWFEVFDITIAYIPMAWLGWKIVQLKQE